MHVKVLCMLASVSLMPTMAETNTPTPFVGIFSKTLTNGTQVVIEKQRNIETRIKPLQIPTAVPTNAIYIEGEYIIDSFRLISTKAGKAEVVWTKDVTHSQIMRFPDDVVMTVIDVEEWGSKVLVLFSSNGHVILDVMKRNTTGQWENEAEKVIGNTITMHADRIVQSGSDIGVVVKRADGSEETIPGYSDQSLE